jgi:acetoin utilization deacetylase AcuC-like enzyme
VRAFYCDHFVLPLPEGHRFPMEKYARLRERIALDPRVTLAVPDAATPEALARVHDPDYVRRVDEGALTREEMRRIGFPWSPQLVERSKRSVGGTIAAASAALEDGAAANLAGGTHHAFSGRGEGFCVFNDVAVAVREVQSRGAAQRVAVLDLDVHQGNGTASIFARDESVFTLSVHGADNFPFRKEQSDLDLALPDGADDARYLEAVELGTRRAFDRAPDIAFYVAGADPYRGDRLGRLSVSLDGLRARDEIVLRACEEHGVPVVVVMSGGYAEDVRDTVAIHAATILASTRLSRRGRAHGDAGSDRSPAASRSPRYAPPATEIRT